MCTVLPLLCLQARDLADFLLPMLAFDPSERATAAQALKHPWLNGPSQCRSSRDERSAAAEEGRSSRHSSRHGSDHGSRHPSQHDTRRSSRADDDQGRKSSGSKRSSRPSAYTRSRSRPRSNSRGYEKRAR
jgi:serine/threonine protein kinase